MFIIRHKRHYYLQHTYQQQPIQYIVNNIQDYIHNNCCIIYTASYTSNNNTLRYYIHNQLLTTFTMIHNNNMLRYYTAFTMLYIIKHMLWYCIHNSCDTSPTNNSIYDLIHLQPAPTTICYDTTYTTKLLHLQ